MNLIYYSMKGNGEGNQQNVRSNKVERKVMEKNRRNKMKLLYSKLNSLLSTRRSNELPLTVLDQLDEAIKYIKSLETKLNMQKEKKERLQKMSSSWSSSYTAASRSWNVINSPELKIKEMGSTVDVVLTTGLDDRFIFYEIIHIFHEERATIINACYSVLGNTIFYSVHAEIEDVVFEFGATTQKLTKRLKRLVHSSDVEMQAATANSSRDHGGSHVPANYTPTSSSNRHS